MSEHQSRYETICYLCLTPFEEGCICDLVEANPAHPFPLTHADAEGVVRLTRTGPVDFLVSQEGEGDTPVTLDSIAAANALWLWWVTK